MKKISREDLIKLEMFTNVKKETIEKLTDYGIKKKYKKGEHIFRDKEKVDNIYIINDGKVSLYKINESAQKKIVFILGKNKVINGVILDNLKASINCEVFEDAEIFCFDKKDFITVMESDFELTKVIIDSLAIKVRRLYRQMKNATPIKVEKRVAAKLWKLSKDYGIKTDDGTLINLSISVTYLAEMFGTPRETISRALKVLQKEELIVYKNKKILIKDRDKLSKFFKGL